MPAERFAFVGFLARGEKKLVEQLARFEGTGAALVAFESPRRVRASLRAIGARWPERRLAVCRELTKLHEEVVRGTAAEVLERLTEPVRGEIVMVLEGDVGRGARAGGYPAGAASAEAEEKVRRALAQLLELGVGTKRAATIIAEASGLSVRRAYELALEAMSARTADER